MSRSSRRISTRLGLTTCLVTALGLAGAGGASAATTIGQLAPGTATATCNTGPVDLVQPTVNGGSNYVVPAGGVAITSWSTNAAAGAGQQLKMKVFRRVGNTNTFTVVAHDGPRSLTPGTVNTFAVNIAVQPGDFVGLNDQNAGTSNNACFFDVPGEIGNLANGAPNDVADGQNANMLDGDSDSRLNISAVVGSKTSNDFDITKVKKNKKKGTAILTVDVPGPGELSLAGPGVKAQRAGGATISKDVTKAGNVTLKVKAKGAKKEKLSDTGKVKVKAQVTFKPAAANGDVAGDPNTEPKKIKLIDK
jgi:hypothetical protein